MDNEQRRKAVLESLEKAISGLSDEEITEERIRPLLNLDADDKGLSIGGSQRVIGVNTTFGPEYFIKLGPPSWVQYIQSRPK